MSQIVCKAAPKSYVATFRFHLIIVNLLELDDGSIKYANTTDYFSRTKTFQESLERIGLDYSVH